jgi:hypothetical protein
MIQGELLSSLRSKRLRPYVFVGSSSENRAIVNAMQILLDHDCDVEPWHQGVFAPASTTMASLLGVLDRCDFAILIVNPDDQAVMRGAPVTLPRDNVLFELGLFMGKLGPSRTFIVFDRTQDLHLPTDLLGVTPATYQPHASGNMQAALGAASTQILDAINREGPRGVRMDRNFTTTHRWGGLVDSLVDAALLVRDHRSPRQEIENCIEHEWVIPSRYHYSDSEAAEIWIRLCEQPTYKYMRSTLEFWSGDLGRTFTDVVQQQIGTDSFDFVSLGPGDGQKDARIVAHWAQAGVDLLYYPYDASVPLAGHAVEAVRARSRTAEYRHGVPTKLVIGDFRDLEHVREVFAHRPYPNVVSLLGTLGNLGSDVRFLADLRGVMGDDDLLILEVRLMRAADEAKDEASLKRLAPEDSLRHDFLPLEQYFNMEWQTSGVGHTAAKWAESDVSGIPETSTLVTEYKGTVRGLGDKRRTVALQYIHLYKADAFLAYMPRAGFEIVHTEIDIQRGFLECLLRKRAAQR